MDLACFAYVIEVKEIILYMINQVNLLNTRLLNGTLANREYLDEMPQSAAFHQGLHKVPTEIQKHNSMIFP